MHVRRAVQGDAESLSWVVARLSPLLRAQAEFRLGPGLRSQHDAEDMVHEAWLVALPQLGNLPLRDGRLTPVLLRFLSTTLLYKIQNLVRQRLRRGPAEHLDVSVPASDLADPRSGVISAAVRRERRDQVHESIAALAAIDREVLLLKGIEQQSNQTIALLLGIEPAAVAMRYQRALQRLRAALPRSVFDELDD